MLSTSKYSMARNVGAARTTVRYFVRGVNPVLEGTYEISWASRFGTKVRRLQAGDLVLVTRPRRDIWTIYAVYIVRHGPWLPVPLSLTPKQLVRISDGEMRDWVFECTNYGLADERWFSMIGIRMTDQEFTEHGIPPKSVAAPEPVEPSLEWLGILDIP